jgi:hypothetical protein
VKVVCIDDNAFIGGNKTTGVGPPRSGDKTSLTIGKTYDVLSEERGFYRVVDDTGDDFLFPKRMFRVLPSS